MSNPYRTKVAFVIPFRDRGGDPLRVKNLDRVLDHLDQPGVVAYVVGDGRRGDEQFNRSAAYNRGVMNFDDPEAVDTFVFYESDMLVPLGQVFEAAVMAHDRPGLVVPFTEYRYLSKANSEAVIRMGIPPGDVIAQRTMRRGASIGAVNVVSRETMELVGQWDEVPDGNWYDDDMMKIAFEKCAGPTRWVEGPAHHLYHLPGWQGGHLTEADRHATRRNKMRLYRYQKATTPEEIRALTMEHPHASR